MIAGPPVMRARAALRYVARHERWAGQGYPKLARRWAVKALRAVDPPGALQPDADHRAWLARDDERASPRRYAWLVGIGGLAQAGCISGFSGPWWSGYRGVSV